MPTAPPPTPPAAKTSGATKRVNDTLIARFERWALPRMAERLPSWVMPDTLTGIAIVSAFVTGAAYYLAGENLNWLWVASLGLVVHWWGDSLDGTLARVRQIRRERYGFFLDHQCDAISAVSLLLGLGLGDLMRLELALGMTIGFLLMMNLVSMVAIARDVFKISFAGGGPTELRLALILGNTAVWALGPWTLSYAGQEWTPFDVLGAIGVVALLGIYLVFAIRETRLIAKLDPPPEPGQDGIDYDPTGLGLDGPLGDRGSTFESTQGDGV